MTVTFERPATPDALSVSDAGTEPCCFGEGRFDTTPEACVDGEVGTTPEACADGEVDTTPEACADGEGMRCDENDVGEKCDRKDENDLGEKRKRADEWDQTNLRYKKISTVRFFVQTLNEVNPDWKGDAGLVRRTFEWLKRAATD